MESNIVKALSEVRKAYRLLFDYQSRILDLMSFIERKIQFNFQSGWPLYSEASPKPGKIYLDQWSWDWLNMYYYQFYFGEKKTNENTIYFGIVHMADSGFFENKNNHDEKINLKKYKKVEESKSKLIFVIGYNMWGNWGNISGNNWNHNDFTNSSQGHSKNDNGGQMIFKSYDLERFISEDSSINTLNDFVMYCEEYNIPFSIENRTIIN